MLFSLHLVRRSASSKLPRFYLFYLYKDAEFKKNSAASLILFSEKVKVSPEINPDMLTQILKFRFSGFVVVDMTRFLTRCMSASDPPKVTVYTAAKCGANLVVVDLRLYRLPVCFTVRC